MIVSGKRFPFFFIYFIFFERIRSLLNSSPPYPRPSSLDKHTIASHNTRAAKTLASAQHCPCSHCIAIAFHLELLRPDSAPSMARRSSRLRGDTPAKSSATHLEPLTEHDETSANGSYQSLDAAVSSPLAPRTPRTALRPKPSAEEMHPSRAHLSTVPEPDSGLRLGFTDIKTTPGGQPLGTVQQSPSKIGISTPTFDFRFARPGPTLGPEAQRMMDELREEALRIKAKLAAEKEEQKRRAGDESIVTGRKIAKPKGKVGRFSDVHMEQFKKMDSIAGHASAFRAQPGRITPATTSLKRTQSKANLDEREDLPAKIASPAAKPQESERLENDSPAKRARRHITDDTSAVRPVSRDGAAKPTTSGVPRPKPGFLSAITTPTQSSLARAATTKHSHSKIHALLKSPSKITVHDTPPRLTKSATASKVVILPNPETKSHLRSPGKFARVRSILRHASSSMKKPLVKPSSIPSLTRSPSKPEFEKALPCVPTTPIGPVRKPVKHVNFTPNTINRNATLLQHSPSPIKSGIPRSISKTKIHTTVSQPNLMVKEVSYPLVANHPNVASRSQTIEYPSLAGVRPLPATPSTSPPHPQPSVPGTFTFRSDHTISFGASPKGFGSSPGQASVRQVRQSILPNTMPGSFPGADKENARPLPFGPREMSNKKRRRVDSDDEIENDSERSPKKQKPEAAEGLLLVAPRLHATPKSRLNSSTKSPAKKGGVLSLSRLNMLSRPKNRK